MQRVEIPAYTDRWMMGDRYGALVKVTRMRTRMTNAVRASLLTNRAIDKEIAHVKLDKSGKTVRVWLDDCRVI